MQQCTNFLLVNHFSFAVKLPDMTNETELLKAAVHAKANKQ